LRVLILRYLNLKIGFFAGCVLVGVFALFWATTRDQVAPVLLNDASPFKSIWLITDEESDRIGLQLVYPFGERANPFKVGLAHYVEHLAWHNVRAKSNNNGRLSNAWTSPYVTGYKMSVLPAEFADAVQQIISTAAPFNISESDALQERDIVAREYDLRVGEDRLKDVRDAISEVLFGDSSYARSVIGSRESIASFNFERASELHRATHQLKQATLLVSGPVEMSNVRDALSELTVPVLFGSALTPVVTLPILEPLIEMRSVVIDGVGQRQLISRSILTTPDEISDATLEALLVVTVDLMMSTKSSGLLKPLRYDAFVVRSFDFQLYKIGPGILELYIFAVPDRGVSLETLSQGIEAALRNARQSVTFEDFKSIRDHDHKSFTQNDNELDENTARLRYAIAVDEPFVSHREYRVALQNLDFETFQTFQTHLANAPRRATWLISPTSETDLQNE
jgi:predicted Zn-dependent peptidase